MTPETLVKKAIVAYLDGLVGCWHAPYFSGGYGKRGVPDRIVCYRGVFIGLEIKAPSGKPTKWQEREIAAIQAAGGIAEVVSSVDAVRAVIARLDATIGLSSVIAPTIEAPAA